MDRLFVFFAPRMIFFSGAAAFLGGIFFFTLAAADAVNVRRKQWLMVVVVSRVVQLATRKSMRCGGERERWDWRR